MDSARDTKSFFASPWVQLVIGVVCMVMIANLQYGWTFFVPDIQKKFGWDRASITAAGFGAGSALTVVPIIAMIKNSGFQAAFFNFGLGQGIIVCIFAFAMFAPKPGQVPEVAALANVAQSRRQFAPNEIIGPNSWWIIGALIALVGGLGMWIAGA